jgi:glucokinase
LGNDCNVAALAEARFGAGQGARRVFYVTVGTGIGGGFVIDGRLDGVDRPAVAELGHLRPGLGCVDPGDTVESLAAGPGIVRIANRLTAEMSASTTDSDRCHFGKAEEVVNSAVRGDSAARRALAHAHTAIGWAVAQVITLLAPDVVVIGGGVSLAGDEWFWKPVRGQVATYVFPPLAECYRLLPPALGEWVVVHGAMANATTGG